MDDVAEFDAGMKSDPEQHTMPEASPERITQALSWWHHRWCATCGHTFRRGDAVVVDDASGTVRHLSPLLNCATPAAHDRDDSDVLGFLEGMQSTWPVEGGLPVSSTDDCTFLLVDPPGAGRRMACLGCGHSFRPHESVIVCPCSPHASACRHAVHRDAGLGLVCWENWRPGGELQVCPVTLRKLNG